MSEPHAQDRARARLVELRDGFATRLGERLVELEALIEQAQPVEQAQPAGPGPTAAFAEAIGAAHRLAGTAGSYGFPEVGEAAAALERALQRIAGGPHDGPHDGPHEWEAVLAALARVRAATTATAMER
jgi:HPt (histidine-containing phosphotransfer) domain-containing protein